MKCFIHFVHLLDLRRPPIRYQLSLRRPYNRNDIAYIILYSFIFLSGTIGNGWVIKMFLQVPKQPGSRFVVILASVDFFTSILVPFETMIKIIHNYHWPFGKIGCWLVFPLFRSTFDASAWLIVAVSLERAR